jgi:pyruvate/2-oxoglutarate dehydrogenase complex dihydrolipoamide dehydrogenase (E3) component
MDKTVTSERRNFDVIVIGAGSGGLNIAAFMNRIGLSVLLIDKEDRAIGGDCLNFGCIPSKALIHAAREVAAARRATAWGIRIDGEVDWKLVRSHIVNAQETIREHENAGWFRLKGMTVVLGEAAFSGPRSVMVKGTEYFGTRIVIATGSRPRQLTGQGIEQVAQVLNNENIFSLERLPRRVLILGGGPIGIEMAQALQNLGVSVTVSDRGEHILGKEDSEIADILQKQLEAEGVTFLLASALQEFTGPNEATFTLSGGRVETVSFDAIFVAIGRELNIEGLALDRAGIETDGKGRLVVNEYLQTSSKHVYACGDVAGNFQFTHAAEMHAAVIIRNMFSPFKRRFSGDHISSVTYTSPEVATFGLAPHELTRRDIAHEVLCTDFGDDDRAITDGYRYGKQKLYVGSKGELLGGTMVAPHAGELMQELVLARSASLPLSALFNKTYAYPTAARINKRTAATYMTRQLTLWRVRLLRLLFKVV